MLRSLRRRIVRLGNDERGFTIVELLVVITVVGILAGVGVSGYGNFRDRANRTAADAAWRDLQVAINLYEVEETEAFPRNSDGGNTTAAQVEEAIASQLNPPPKPLTQNLWGPGFPTTNNDGHITAGDNTGFVVVEIPADPGDPDNDDMVTITCVWMNGIASDFNHDQCKNSGAGPSST